MRKILMILVALIVMISGNSMAQTRKPIDAVRNYDSTIYGVENTGTLGYSTLYRGDYNYGLEDSGCHPGVDIPCGKDTPVYTIADGTVIKAHSVDDNDWGKYIIIKHDVDDITGLEEPIYSIYAHLDDVLITLNQGVDIGDHIGNSGNTGLSTGETGYHLHFQIDRHTVMNGSSEVTTHDSPYWWPGHDAADDDVDHIVDNNTINPMAFIKTGSTVPVGFVLNADYSGYPHWENVDGLSQAFRDAWYDFFFDHLPPPAEYDRALGYSLDNTPEWLPYGQAVHKVDDMWIQDFYGPDNQLNLPYSALIRGEGETGPVRLLKEGFWDWWINSAGWEDVGYPVTEEYVAGQDTQQTFRKNGVSTVYVWNYNTQTVEFEELNGTALNAYDITFASLAKAADDGIYHSGLLVTDLGTPIKMVEGRTHDGFYAMIGGEQVWIDPFTVTGDMTIVVGATSGDDIQFDHWLISLNPGAIDQALHSHAYLFNAGIADVVLSEISLELIDPNGQSVYNYSSSNITIESGELYDYYSVFYPEMAGEHMLRVSGLVNGQWYTYDEEMVFIAAVALNADFSVSLVSGQAPLIVQFTDLSVGDPTSWSWNFGDENSSTQQNPSHTYTTPGLYGIRLVVTNARDSASEIKSSYIIVTNPPAPIANFSATPTSGVLPLDVQFTDLSTGNPTSWYWVFGDGYVSSSWQNPNHTYNTAGTYNVRLSASNDSGSDSILYEGLITVEELSPLEAIFLASPTSGDVPLIVQFEDRSTGNSTSWDWTFGDGGISTDQNPSHEYNAPGVYDIFLTVSDGVTSHEGFVLSYITVGEDVSGVGDDIRVFALHANHPNPFNPQTTISYSLPSTQRVRLSIYDVTGRIIVTLVDGVLEQGSHTALWNGHNIQGQVVGSGVYFYQLTTVENTRTRKMLLVK